MALPPSPIAGEPMPTMPDETGGAPGEDMGGEGGGDWVVCCTILKNEASGAFKLVSGDEPEGDPAMAEGQEFPDGPQLLKAVMAEVEGTKEADADAGFEEGYTGKAPPAKEPMPARPMPMA